MGQFWAVLLRMEDRRECSRRKIVFTVSRTGEMGVLSRRFRGQKGNPDLLISLILS